MKIPAFGRASDQIAVTQPHTSGRAATLDGMFRLSHPSSTHLGLFHLPLAEGAARDVSAYDAKA
jgi:hypothetical protein